MMKRWGEVLLTSCATLTWGSTYLVITEFMSSGRPILVGLLRALPAGLLMLAFYRRLPTGIWWWRSIVLGLLNFGIFFPLLFAAAYRLPGGVAATLGAIQPLLAAVIAWLLLRERPTRVTIWAGAVGVVGVGMIVLGPSARLDMLGVLIGFAATLCMSSATVLARHWGRPVPLPLFTAWQLITGGLVLIPLTFIFEGPFPVLTTTELLGAAWLAIMGTGFAYLLWFRGIEKIGTAVSFLMLLTPVMAIMLGLVVLDQRLSLVQIGGIALVLGSVYAGQRFGSSGPPQRSDAVGSLMQPERATS